jgi:hypothetical protein
MPMTILTKYFKFWLIAASLTLSIFLITSSLAIKNKIKNNQTKVGSDEIMLGSGGGQYAFNPFTQNFDYYESIASSTLNELSDISVTSATTGDIIYRNSSNEWVNLAVGNNGQVLKVTTGLPAWGTDNTGSGGGSTTTITTNIVSQGNDFTFTTSSATGLNFNISGSGATINFAPALQSGYNIPLTASTSNWNTAYLWGNHADANYLTSETDPVWMAASSSYLTTATAASTYQPIGSYLTVESDPIWLAASTTYLATTTAAATYEPILTKGNLTASSPLQFNNTRQVIGGTAQISVASGYNIPLTASTTNWETAYLWGNHADASYLTSYTETDPIWLAASSSYLTTATAGTTYPSFTYASSSYATLWNLKAGTNITISTSSGVTISATGGGITSLGEQTGATQTFSTSTSGGLSLFINSSANNHAFTLQPTANYSVPLTASTTEWATTRNTVTAGATNWDTAYTDRLKWDGSLVTNASTTNLSVATRSYLNLVSSTAVTATTFYGSLSGNALTATALQNNPSDCSANQFAYQIDASGNLTCSSIDISASTNLSVTATGLELSGDAIALSTGYIIPLSASTTQWAGFYNTPSTRITAGTNLSWDGNTLNASGGGSGSDVNWATSTAGSDILLYPVSTAYDVAFGGNSTATAPFWWDVSATSTYIGNGGNGDSLIQLGQAATAWSYGHKASDNSFVISSSTSLGTNDVLVISKGTGAVRIVNALNASSTLAVTGATTLYSTLNVSGETTLGLASTTAVTATDFYGTKITVTNASTTGVTATTFYGALQGNASTATALASDPSDCGANTWATTIAANGNLTCAAVTYAGISSMTSANWAGVISDETGTGALVFNTNPIFLTSMVIPTSTNPTVDVVGKIAINTTAASSSIRWHDGVAEQATYSMLEKSLYMTSSTIDKDSNTFKTATTTFEIYNSARGFTVNQFYCKTDTGTLLMRIGDGTNWSSASSCTNTGTLVTSISNNTFIPREDLQIQIGTSASSPNKITVTIGYTPNAD